MTRRIIMVAAVVLTSFMNCLYRPASSYLISSKPKSFIRRKDLILKVTVSSSNSQIEEIKSTIERKIESTERGLSTTIQEQEDIEMVVQALEKNCPLAEPARSLIMGDKWIVDYTTAPPPSNGKLGPFVGVARQIIDLHEGTYVNYLSVPGEIEKEWLSAKLEATFEEWDGTLLEDERLRTGDTEVEMTSTTSIQDDANDTTADKNWMESLMSFLSQESKVGDNSVPSIDYGANSWKVDFQSLTIRLFGIQILKQTFKGTSRIWKMTYLDDDTRIVRAGRTGMNKDDMMFYMSRDV